MAVTIHSLVYRAVYDASSIKSGMVATRSELAASKKLYAETRTDTEKYGASVDALGRLHQKKAIDADTYRRSMERLNAEFKQTAISKDLAGTGSMLAGQVPGVTSFTSALKTIGPIGAATVLGLGAVTAGLDLLRSAFSATAEAVVEGMERIDSTNDFAKRVGISNEALAGFRLAAELGGVSAGEFDSDLEKMLKNIDKAAVEGGDAARSFERLGLDIDRLAAQRPEQTFLDIADAVAGIKDPYERARVAQDIFGKSGQALNTVLADGAEGLRRSQEEARAMGLAVDDIDAASVAAANDEFDKAKKLIEGAANSLAVELAPAIGDVSSELVQLSKDFGGVGLAVKDLIHFAKKDLQDFADFVRKISPTVDAGVRLGQFGVGEVKGIRERTQDLDRQIVERQSRMSEEERRGAGREDPEVARKMEDIKRRRAEREQQDAQGKDAEADATAARRKADKLREQIAKDMAGSSSPAVREALQERIAKNQAELDKLMGGGPDSERQRPMGLGRNPFLEAGLKDLAEANKPNAQQLIDDARATAEREGADLLDPAAREKAAKAVERIRGLADPAKAIADAARETAERVGAVIDPAMQGRAEEAAQKIRDLMDPAKALANAARETAERMGATLDDPAAGAKAEEIVERIRAGAGKSPADKAREALQKNLEQQAAPEQSAAEREIVEKVKKRALSGAATDEQLREYEQELRDDAAAKEWEKEIRDGEKMANEAIKDRKEAEKRMQGIEESGISKEDLRRRKLFEDINQLDADSKTLGMSDKDRAAAEEQIRSKFDEDMNQLAGKDKNRQRPSNRAFERGSAEAFSFLNQAATGGGKNTEEKTETNTAKTAKAAEETAKQLKNLNETMQRNLNRPTANLNV